MGHDDLSAGTRVAAVSSAVNAEFGRSHVAAAFS
jgi:hypothetical protein